MSIVSSFASPVASPDVIKAVGAFTAVIPAAGTAAVVNPADDHNGVSMLNVRGSNWVRATITFKAGITGDATVAQQVQLIPPGGVVNLDFSSEANSVSGSIAAIDSISLVSVALPPAGTAAAIEASTMTALAALADATVVLNFATR